MLRSIGCPQFCPSLVAQNLIFLIPCQNLFNIKCRLTSMTPGRPSVIELRPYSGRRKQGRGSSANSPTLSRNSRCMHLVCLRLHVNRQPLTASNLMFPRVDASSPDEQNVERTSIASTRKWRTLHNTYTLRLNSGEIALIELCDGGRSRLLQPYSFGAFFRSALDDFDNCLNVA